MPSHQLTLVEYQKYEKSVAQELGEEIENTLERDLKFILAVHYMREAPDEHGFDARLNEAYEIFSGFGQTETTEEEFYKAVLDASLYLDDPEFYMISRNMYGDNS